ncbi:MAG: discoidin domain-containing protein [Spirochaetales bacterium]|nr:discoidin domain-containing protein [Spirochaetales bacterium]
MKKITKWNTILLCLCLMLALTVSAFARRTTSTSTPTPAAVQTNSPVPTTPPSNTTNLALNRPATSSSDENASFTANYAVDGNTGTRWSSGFSDPQWIQVDLGTTANVSSVVLRWEPAYATSYQIQISSDASNWTTLWSTTSGSGGNVTINVSGSGRYVRMYGTARATQWGYSLWEFEVYGSGGGVTSAPNPTATPITQNTSTPTPTRTPTTAPTVPPSTTNIALNKIATSSSDENSGTTANNAVDGNTGTRWSSAFSDPQWIQIDLGATASISSVVLRWETACASAYQIQISSNASSWTTLWSTSSGSGGNVTINLSGSGRYIRMYGTARATAWGYSLWEFEVYGTGGATPPPNPTATPSPTQGSGTGTLFWADEFDGSSVNTAYWSYEVGGTGWGNNELEYYTNGLNSSIQNGVLVIEARRESYGGMSYTSSRMITYNKVQRTYGRIESRIQLPMGQGIWPAFWMLGTNIMSGTAWPACGEIDIMEHINNDQQIVGTIHWDANGVYANYGGTAACNPATYHVYAIDWDSAGIRWYLDGAQYWIADTANNINGTEEFHRPFFIILNVAVGGNWPGSPDASTVFPARMYVDYVRWYQ